LCLNTTKAEYPKILTLLTAHFYCKKDERRFLLRKASALTVTDQFCGAGGSSLGATAAGAEVILALNHWKLAVETYNTNFPNTRHDCTDISACDPRRYPSTNILITSPECTNHSLAKGRKRKKTAQPCLTWETSITTMQDRSHWLIQQQAHEA
jgi:DNA (cytosine-5)-methyltransferase 1